MTIADGKKRVVLMFPEYAIEAFKDDARRLNMSLSGYAFMILGSHSYNLPESESDFLCDTLSATEELIYYSDAVNSERFESLKKRYSKKNSDKNS